MELKFSKTQKAGMMGNRALIMAARIFPTPEERAVIEQFNLTKQLLWQWDSNDGRLGKNLGVKAITVNSLMAGVSLTSYDVVQLLHMEKVIIDKTEQLKNLIERSGQFLGEHSHAI